MKCHADVKPPSDRIIKSTLQRKEILFTSSWSVSQTPLIESEWTVWFPSSEASVSPPSSPHSSTRWWESLRRSGRNQASWEHWYAPRMFSVFDKQQVGCNRRRVDVAPFAACLCTFSSQRRGSHNEPKSRSNKSITNYKKLKAGTTLYFHSKIQKEKIFTDNTELPSFSVSNSPPGQLSLLDSESVAASCTNQQSAEIGKGGGKWGREVDRKKEREQRGGEDQSQVSNTRGNAKNNSLIIHTRSFEVADRDGGCAHLRGVERSKTQKTVQRVLTHDQDFHSLREEGGAIMKCLSGGGGGVGGAFECRRRSIQFSRLDSTSASG